MEAGAHVWCDDTDGDEAWILAEVIKRTEDQLHLQQVDKPEKSFTRPISVSVAESGERKYKGVELANAKLSQADRDDGRDDDLITLPHLHEPAILHAISERFFYGKIYTWTGPVLIALNPFERLPLYTTEILEKYRREGLLRSQNLGGDKPMLGPHVYAIADRSYRQMMGEGRKSQSILISGESGAGKTESTKIVMLYLTTLGSANMNVDNDDGEPAIMGRVLQSNPILEAFGNSRTLRNDNSSRFGKFIELGFSRAGHLLGARVQTYLLEKVRLAFHASGERNYHIFYQLLRGATEEQKKNYEFHDGATQGLELPNYFHYTGQGGAPYLREFSDEDGFEYTLKAMKGLGWAGEKIDSVLSLVAGLLHLGQITFVSVENESGIEAAQVTDAETLEASAHLLGVDVDMLQRALTERVIVARGQEITTQLTADRATDARDAVAKTVYGALFLWVVNQVNQSIFWENDDDVRSTCGVLDIFGFECFAVNSFEQLCINFTNEALQQQFNKFIFKMEQAEYEREEIEWAFISFPDNQDCLDTIQTKQTGILAMLDDECRLPKGSDRNWANRMYDHFLPSSHQVESENTRFSATPVQKSKSIFCVRHFAGVVQYSAETGFMEKNKDEIPLTAQNLFQTAPSSLVKEIYAIQKRESEDAAAGALDGGGKGKAAKSKTVGMQFKQQLQSLIENVGKTDPHYIRCLKSNDAAKPKTLTRKRLTEQLRYGGVLEAVRVARMGYPVRLDHGSFFQRYRMLLPSTPEESLPWNLEGQIAQKVCVKLLECVLEEGARQNSAVGSGLLSPDEDGISRTEKIRRMQIQPSPITFPKTEVQLGLTKVFMRKAPHDALEAHRVFQQNSSATLIQSWVRGLEQRKQYLIISNAALAVQRFYRGYVGRKRWWTLRRAVAGQLLTNNLRMAICLQRFRRAKRGAIRSQALYRGYATRRSLAVVKLQTFLRMRKLRILFVKLKSATLSLQCACRVRRARKELEELRREQKDIGKLKQNNEKLKLEMASLKAMLAAQAKGNASRIENEKEMEAKQTEISKLEKRVEELELELEKEKTIVREMESRLQRQKEEAAREKEHWQNIHKQQLQRRSNATPHPQRSPASPKVHLPVSSEVVMPTLSESYVSPGVLAEHKAHVARLEEELEAERRFRREADGEIIKLRAAINGVNLDDSDVDALLAQKLDSGRSLTSRPDAVVEDGVTKEEVTAKHQRREAVEAPNLVSELAPEVTGAEEEKEPLYPPGAEAERREELQKLKDVAVTPEVVTALNKLGIGDAKNNHVFSKTEERTEKRAFLLKSPSEYLPMIRRGFTSRANEEDAEEVMAVGWKHEVRNRKEREEALRDDVHRFEVKMKKFNSTFEEGVDVVMWQFNRNAELGVEERDEFALTATPVTVKLHRRGDLFVQAVLAFSMRGGYLSKALGRHRVDKSALDPLSLHDILEVKAGCSGYDHTELPTSSAGKTKARSKGSTDNRQSSLFVTLKATPTPVASSRSYFLRFKSRSARNDLMNGLRGLLADMQIHEGVTISSLHKADGDYDQPLEKDEIMVPLSEVHHAINREREVYDRLLLLLLQGNEDLAEKEDELLGLRGKLENVLQESAEKDRVQANDSKLIMQLSKKLETLLMENEDLRDQNDRLNTRLVAVECEKMNLMSG